MVKLTPQELSGIGAIPADVLMGHYKRFTRRYAQMQVLDSYGHQNKDDNDPDVKKLKEDMVAVEAEVYKRLGL